MSKQAMKLAEIDELRAKPAAAETSANELRRAVAELIGADSETWPNHGNAPLAIAACVALRQAELASLEAKLAAQAESEKKWIALHGAVSDLYEKAKAKLAALEVLYLNSLADATQWQLYKSRKDAVIAAGMGKKAMRDSAAGAAPVPEGWQPIETAPKDGLPFRAYSKDLIDLDFNPNGSVECCWDGAEFVGCVWDGQQDAWYGKAISPTHWMPLPEAPKEQTP